MAAIAEQGSSTLIVPAFSVRSKAWVVAEALGGFGLECFGSGPAVVSAWSHCSWCVRLSHQVW